MHEVSTRSGPGSTRGQPAWGGGCNRELFTAKSPRRYRSGY